MHKINLLYDSKINDSSYNGTVCPVKQDGRPYRVQMIILTEKLKNLKYEPLIWTEIFEFQGIYNICNASITENFRKMFYECQNFESISRGMENNSTLNCFRKTFR
jgi:hypothetical protein